MPARRGRPCPALQSRTFLGGGGLTLAGRLLKGHWGPAPRVHAAWVLPGSLLHPQLSLVGAQAGEGAHMQRGVALGVRPEPCSGLPQVSGARGVLTRSWHRAGCSGHRSSLGQVAGLLCFLSWPLCPSCSRSLRLPAGARREKRTGPQCWQLCGASLGGCTLGGRGGLVCPCSCSSANSTPAQKAGVSRGGPDVMSSWQELDQAPRGVQVLRGACCQAQSSGGAPGHMLWGRRQELGGCSW